MAEYPFTIKQKNQNGEFDTLYPETIGSQVKGMTFENINGNLDTNRLSGNIPSSKITGTFPSTSIVGQFPSSQIDGIYTENEILIPNTASLFGLSGNQALPNNVFIKLANSILFNPNTNELNLPNGNIFNLDMYGYSHMEYGTYTGTGSYGSTKRSTNLTTHFPPKIVFIFKNTDDSKDDVNFALFAETEKSEDFKSFGFYQNIRNTSIDDVNIDFIHVQFLSNGVSWYSTYSSSRQLNSSYTDYYYYIFG